MNSGTITKLIPKSKKLKFSWAIIQETDWIIGKKIVSYSTYGKMCIECGEHNEFAEANCKNNKFMCYSCRKNNHNKFCDLKC